MIDILPSRVADFDKFLKVEEHYLQEAEGSSGNVVKYFFFKKFAVFV